GELGLGCGRRPGAVVVAARGQEGGDDGDEQRAARAANALSHGRPHLEPELEAVAVGRSSTPKRSTRPGSGKPKISVSVSSNRRSTSSDVVADHPRMRHSREARACTVQNPGSTLTPEGSVLRSPV